MKVSCGDSNVTRALSMNAANKEKERQGICVRVRGCVFVCVLYDMIKQGRKREKKVKYKGKMDITWKNGRKNA